MASNGRLPSSSLTPITKAANGEQAYLRKDAARAFMAMNAESERRFGVTLRAASARVAYRTYAQQQYFWDLYVSGRGNLAARPGTSNHGLGLAIDLATEQMRRIVDKIGAKYGFAKKWSDAPSEWWHIKWAPEHCTADLTPDPLQHDESRWVNEYKKLSAIKRPTPSQKKRRVVLFRVIKARRKSIYRAAQKSGWTKYDRRQRYQILYRVTGGN